MINAQLSDEEFLAAFESATLHDFHHADHIRAAWLYLLRFPFPEASQRMAESVWHFAAQHGAHTKYHETITRAWMRLVWDALRRDLRAATGKHEPEDSTSIDAPPSAVSASHPAAGFDAFAAAHPELLDVRTLDRFYSHQVLTSLTARTQFVPPDLSPLP